RERQELSTALDLDGLQPRLLAAAEQHQHSSRARLRARRYGDAGSDRNVLSRVQRILRFRPSHDGRSHLRSLEVDGNGSRYDISNLPALRPAVRTTRRKTDDRERRHRGRVPAARRHSRGRHRAHALARGALARSAPLLSSVDRARPRHAVFWIIFFEIAVLYFCGSTLLRSRIAT